MKESVLKVVKKLSPGKAARAPVAALAGGPEDAAEFRRPGKVAKPARPKKPAPPVPAPADVTGQTVFDDRALRFRNLTMTEADMPAIVEAGTIEGAFKIRVAKRTGARRAAGALVERRYTGRGYSLPGKKKSPLLSTFIAYDEGLIVGTVGVGLDSVKGLGADELYKQELDALRAQGFTICEFTRLAVDRTAASKPVLAGLFHTAYLYAAVIKGCTHAVIEVNPRHVAFYGKALNFEAIGPERLNKRVNAPAILLCTSFKTIADGLASSAGKKALPGTSRSLFYYGFPAEDERGVLGRLRQLADPPPD